MIKLNVSVMRQQQGAEHARRVTIIMQPDQSEGSFKMDPPLVTSSIAGESS